MAVKDIEIKVDSDRGAIARPVVVAVNKNEDTVVITNKTADAIEISIPKAGIRNVSRDKGGSLTLTPADLAKLQGGRYAYAVYCHEVEDFAEGASSPEIIIRP